MIDDETYNCYVNLLRDELIPALGCTEPIAIAYAAAVARKYLVTMPDIAEIRCSGNIIKNVKGVKVPNTNGEKGIDIAALAGFIGGNPSKGLQVLDELDDKHRSEINRLAKTKMCTIKHIEGKENLFINIVASSGCNTVEVKIEESHTNITYISYNGKIIVGSDYVVLKRHNNNATIINNMNIKKILEFADIVLIKDIENIILPQIVLNSNISDEGLKNSYGVSVGKTILKYRGKDLRTRAIAKAAAGSDARMSGSSLPVVINSGSGNQGMTVSLPVIEYAKDMKVSKDKLYRALIVSNLVAIHQKKYIGKLSAFCGAVCAACGSGAGIAYIHNKSYKIITDTITNTIANIGGMVCDGAKPSCAAKIASAVEASLLAYELATENKAFASGEGIVDNDVEGTIKNIGEIAKIGMLTTDKEILRIMISG